MTNEVLTFITHPVLISAVAASLLSQIIKTIIFSIQHHKFDLERFIRIYGGMPSSHTAFMMGATTAIYFIDGITNLTIFALIVSILVMRDVLGSRWFWDRKDKTIARIAEHIKKHKLGDIEYTQEIVGHTLPEVIVGILIGIITAYLILLI